MASNQKLLIDKIAFTQPIDKDQRLTVIERLSNKDVNAQYKGKFHRKRPTGRYNNNYGFNIVDDTIATISAYPIRKSQNFFRAEYNPTKLKRDGQIKLRRFFIKVLKNSTVKLIYFHAPITRIDITLDVYDMEPNLYIHLPRFRYSKIHRANDRILSQIIGNTGECRLTMYDKNLERGIEDSGHNSYQRIEVRFRNLRCSMHQLTDKKISNHLLKAIKQLKFYRSGFLNDKSFSKSFRDNAYANGLNAALNDIDDNKRRRYRRYLETYRAYPISTKGLNINKARALALNTLVHLGYRDQYLAETKLA